MQPILNTNTIIYTGFIKVTKTLEELAQSNISELNIQYSSVFSPEDPASKVLGVFKDTNRNVAVAANGKRYGVIAVRDLLIVDQPANTKIESVWRQVGSVSPNTSVLDVVDLIIRNNLTAMPVVSRDEVGIISQQDITGALAEVPELQQFKAKDIMVTPVHSVAKDTPIAHARSTMLERGISHIPVINGDKPLGIVTGDNIVTTFVTSQGKTTFGNRSGEKPAKYPGQVSGIMDRPPVTIQSEANVLDVVKTMNKMASKYCLVVDESDKLFGIITHRELLEVIHSLQPEPELPVYIVGIDDEDFFEKAIVEDKIRRTVMRSMRIMEDITEVSVRVKSQRNKGERTRYSITARAMGPTVNFNVENEDWGLMETFDGLVDALDKSLRRAKKEPQKGARRGRKRPNPHLKP
jgi:CBS domain-containing protein/ribosome-associated translation inhibitor RaiA